MQTMPDFGYHGDNFVIERDTEAPRNWKLLTDFVYNKDKYEWLQNHLTLRRIRQQQTDEDEKIKKSLVNKKAWEEKHKKIQDVTKKVITGSKDM